MKPKLTTLALVAVGVVAFAVGTVFSGEGQETPPATPPGPPPPPAELKALDGFVGQWQSEYEFMPEWMGQPGNGTGTTSCQWVLNGWFVMSKFHGSGTMGDYDSIGMMTYDPADKTYRTHSFDGFGQASIADMAYDPQNKAWTITSEEPDAMTGQPLKTRTTLRFVTPDKLEWEYAAQRQGEPEFTVFMKGKDTRISQPTKK
ncbi:MAG TPA: DUF1579 family protein [Phycisphaerae bacterium]|nr:DUF1579 family protein [Phycisphaerae bacterium]